LVGESNNGKTALYNSLFVPTYNVNDSKETGKGYVRRVNGKAVKGGCRVDMVFDDVSVVFAKSTSPAFYVSRRDTSELSIQDMQEASDILFLDKAGKGDAPEQVQAALRMQPLELDDHEQLLNFLPQLSTPLIKGLSGAQLYKLAVKSYEGEKIRDAISLCKADVQETSGSLDLKRTSIDVAKRTKLQLLDQLDCFGAFVEVEQYITWYEQAQRKLSALITLLERRISLLEDIGGEQKILTILNGLNDLFAARARYDQLYANRQSLEAFLVRRTDLQRRMSVSIESVDVVAGAFTALEKESSSLVLTRDGLSYVDSVLLSMETVDSRLQGLVSLLDRRYNVEHDLDAANKLVSILDADFGDVEAYTADVRTLSIVEGYLARRNELLPQVSTLDVFDGIDWAFLETGSVLRSNLQHLLSAQDRRTSLLDSISAQDVSSLSESLKEKESALESNLCFNCGSRIE
jgi:hypothetical protein